MKQDREHPAGQPDSLHGRFEQQALRWPQRLALSYRGQHLSYQQLNERADERASQLRAAGVQAGDLVALMLPRGLDLVVQVLAVLKAGAGYVPIDPNYPQERVDWMLESSQPVRLLTHRHLANRLWEAGVPEALHNRIQWIDVDEPHSAAPLSPARGRPTDAGQTDHSALAVAYIIFTSGSTGKPKGVMVGHHQVMYLLDAVIPRLHCDQTDVWTLFHSLAFDFSVWELWGALTTGGRLCIVPQDVTWSADSFAALLRAEQVTVLNQTPSAFYALTQTESQLLAQGDNPLPLRSVIFGGEALNMHQIKRWWSLYAPGQPRLINMYGITETTVHVTWLELTQTLADTDGSPIGEAIPGLEVHLLNSALAPVAEGEPGEIHVGGRQLALGYLGRPDLTASRFIADPIHPGQRLYRSGDLAVRRAGQLFYLGRADRQLKIRGFRIEPAEVEAAIESHPAVQRCAVLAQPAKAGHTSDGLLAFLVATAGVDPLPEATDLRRHLAERLPVHCLPAEFLFLEKLPLTVNGKLDQAVLLTHWRAQQPPDNAQQRRLELLRAKLAETVR
jgi:nonribosomal peptide synthetase DhbF